MCQHRNRATRSLVNAGGGDDRKVARHRARTSSRPSDRIRSISASVLSRSDERSVMPVTPALNESSAMVRSLMVGVVRLGFCFRGLAGNDAVDAIAVGLLGV